MPHKPVYLNLYGLPCEALQRFTEKTASLWLYETEDGEVAYVGAVEARRMQAEYGGNIYPPED